MVQRLFPFNFICNIVSFTAFIIRAVGDNIFSFRVLCPKIFRLTVAVMRNDCVGCTKYFLGRAVILLEHDFFRVWIILLEIQYVRNICPAPAVYGLVCVTDDAEILVSCCQKTRQLILGVICVLILVNEDISESALIFFPDLIIGLQNVNCQKEQIIEIKCIVITKLCRIHAVNLCYLCFVKIPCSACKSIRTHKLILRI